METGNWFSILYNGVPIRFFNLSRCVRQGDPLSPTLFILATEASSRGLKLLFQNGNIRYYAAARNRIPVSHLAYADDVIIFLNASKNSVGNLMKFISTFESHSRQLVNRAKSSFYMSGKLQTARMRSISRLSGFTPKSLPFSYLGFLSKKERKIHTMFQPIIDNWP
ncbi:hypothetical protein ACH5RR_000848 [Cinchona calisaya]|uniref:Reverse transcriptase domain-containing protein n=1 Tax=Cinchona calisaya TaxID=153742 RepID=A0ABD3B1R4_9GENT